ncbi:MAG: DUF3047 domain-containing protein [Candidatus Omnitrophota bacterium]
MRSKKKIKIILILIAGCITLLAGLIYFRSVIPEKKAAVGWKEDFSVTSGKRSLPKGWKLRKKPMTKAAVFSVRRDAKEDTSFLHMEAGKASATLITKVDGVDIAKTPFLRWRWRVTTLPKNADGRLKSKDDQAIGLYVGSGSAAANKSVSYRWDTETPRQAEGNCAYGLGKVKVRWITLRNKEDKTGRWFTEERNVAEDFKKAWGFYPKAVYVSVSCNSQYTRSQAAADLAWIEFTSVPIVKKVTSTGALR